MRLQAVAALLVAMVIVLGYALFSLPETASGGLETSSVEAKPVTISQVSVQEASVFRQQPVAASRSALVTAAPTTTSTTIQTRRAVVISGEPASNRALGATMAAGRGWSGRQWECLDQLWGEYESGWVADAGNPEKAYGIPQAKPGDKMAAAGADWQTNPRTQISWGLDYISHRYDSPCAALEAWLSRSSPCSWDPSRRCKGWY